MEGILYQGFTREQDYSDVCGYAAEFGYILWQSDAQRLVVLSVDGHEHIRTWLKSLKK